MAYIAQALKCIFKIAGSNILGLIYDYIALHIKYSDNFR